MTSINDSISSDLLFNIFQQLDCIETTIIRRVCKQWFEIIDEHKSFWRTLHLSEKSVEGYPSTLTLFDRKSGSTLQDVDIGMTVEWEHLNQIIDTLKKSKAHLKHLFLKFRGSSPFGQDLLESLHAAESLRLLSWNVSHTVCLRRKSDKSDSQEDGSTISSPLRVFWYRDDLALLQIKREKFKNLVSLDTAAELSPSEWRDLLEGPSRRLKHLRVGFGDSRDEDHGGVSVLEFPNLEVLELNSSGRFPRWILIPDSATLIAHSTISNLPSISGLWSMWPHSHKSDIVNRLPKLRTLSLLYLGDQMWRALDILNERQDNVDAGSQVDGVKMEMIRNLIVPLEARGNEFLDPNNEWLRCCRTLVEVVEGDAESRFIEIEV